MTQNSKKQMCVKINMVFSDVDGLKHYLERLTTFAAVIFISFIVLGNFLTVALGDVMEPNSDCIECHSADIGITESISSVLADAQQQSNQDNKPASIQIIDSNIELLISDGHSHGGADCVACHDITGGGPTHLEIDILAIKQSVHKNLNNGTSNITLLTDPIDKACWACHGDGTEPSDSHPINYNIPYTCEDCHNSTSNLTYTNLTVIPNLTTRIVYQHIENPNTDHLVGYTYAISSIQKDLNATCIGCHNISKVSYTDSGFSLHANVSHYATTTELVTPTINCNLCHKDNLNADIYWANVIRHPAMSNEYTFCRNCHNTTQAVNFHSQPLVKPSSVHSGFDWQDDDYIESHDPSEGCSICHSGHHGFLFPICEVCHLENGSGPGNLNYRPDLNDTMPRVYGHTNFSSKLNVPNQSIGNERGIYTTCFAFDSNASNRTCHGIAYNDRDLSGGYYAFKGTGVSSPYHNTMTIDDLPDTTNCAFCHNQSESTIRSVWGNPSQITGGTHDWYTDNDAQRCWDCHVEDGTTIKDFHSVNITGGGGPCIECHTTLSSADLGLHSTLNGTSDIDRGDCETCHFDSPHSGVSPANTYYCPDCHTSTGTSPVKSTIEFVDKLHGENTCTDCHVADGTYHQDDPRGSVANLTYVDRDGTGNTIVTDCADCHNASNLDEGPFNAPAGGSHILQYGGACDGSCHTSGQPTIIETVHDVGVGPDWGDKKPSITVPVLEVSPGTDVTITATVTTVGTFHYVDGAQYRIMDGATEVIPWTPMTAVDGDFEGANEDVTITFNTSMLLLGTYTVEVRGMAGGPPQVNTQKYYPINGDISPTKITTLNVIIPPGYINGTVTNNSIPVEGVTVSTAGVSDITDSNGLYSLVVPAGTYTVIASKLPEYNDNTSTGVMVVSGTETPLDIVLAKKSTGTITGTVKNETGATIMGAFVQLDTYPQYNNTTDANGQYSIPNVPIGIYLISASAPGYATNLSTVTVDSATVTKDFILTPGGITGDYRYYAFTDAEIAANKVSTLSDIGTSFTIPQYGDGVGWHTDVYVTDYSGLGAALTLEYYYPNGTLAVTENPNIAANATYKWTPSEGTNGRPTTGKLVVTSDNNVVGGFKIYSTSTTDMMSSKLYTSADTTTSFTIPQYGDGVGWHTWVAISDGTGLGASITLEFYYPNGTLAMVETSSVTANGMYTFLPSDGTNGRPTSGKLQITSDNAIVGEYRIFSTGIGGIISNKLYTSASKGNSFIIPQYGDGIAWNTWVAISDDSGLGASLTLEFYHPNGTLAVTEVASISANGMYSFLPTDGTNGRPATGKLSISSDNTTLGEVRIFHVSGRGIMANSLFTQQDVSNVLIVPYYGNNVNFGTYLSIADVTGIDTLIRVDYHQLDGTLAKTEFMTISADGLVGLVLSDGTNGKPTEGNVFVYT